MRGDPIPQGIDEFRTWRYRVFQAAPYFNVDPFYEIPWHSKKLKQLKHQKKNPSSFHRERTSHKITQDHIAHFKEQVIEAIPFHEMLLKEHIHRKKTMKGFMSTQRYKKLLKISLSSGGVPDYFVFDKVDKKFFFVVDHLSADRKRWMNKTKKLAKTVVFEQ